VAGKLLQSLTRSALFSQKGVKTQMNHDDAIESPDTFGMQDRRAFCRRAVSLAAIGGGFAAILPGCSGSNASNSIQGDALATVNGDVSNGAVTVGITTGSPLATTGSQAMVTSSAGNFLVTRTGDAAFSAVTANCTHEACLVSNHTGQTFVCPCHGSQFDASGHVVQGPATSPLRQYQTQFAGNILKIS
jgi:cytochrome b6-f complex iron-sulfur subunit